MDAMPETAAMLVIDVQESFAHPSWGRRNNPLAEDNIGRLLAEWRQTARPVYHVRHRETDPNGSYRPGQIGGDFKAAVRPVAGERVVEKQLNSAFVGTGLEAALRAGGSRTLIVTGVVTNNAVEDTARTAGNLGFETYVVSDATATVDTVDINGRRWRAENVHALSLANLQREYARVVTTGDVLRACVGRPYYQAAGI